MKKEKADLIIHNAVVYTVDKGFTKAEAFAVKEGKIVAVGSNEYMLNDFEADQKLDLDGKPVYPGFIDPHCHFLGYGLNLQSADLVGTSSYGEVLDKVKKHAEKAPTEWLTGRGWDQNDWEIKKYPTKEKLDSLFPNRPVMLTRIDGHAVLANSVALEKAGITASTKVDGGEVIIENGEPTGVLIDNAIELVNKIIPETTLAAKKEALLQAQRNCFSVGLTTVSDAGLDKSEVELIDTLHKQGKLKLRVYAMLNPTEENMENFVKNGPYLTEQLSVRSVKTYADGALGSRGARLLEPYSDDPDNRGLFLHKPDYFRRIAEICKQHGYQLNTHCIGDGAARMILDIYGEYLEAGNDLRWRIEHAQIVHPDDQEKFGKHDVVASVQTTHATSDMYWADERLGPERIRYAYAYKDLLEQNGWLANGSDFPIEDINPLYGFYAAVARRDLNGWPEGGFQMENALSREEALKAMTIWAAKANFEEELKGSIETGKLADFVVLEKDIMEVDLEEVPDVKVLRTFIGGEEAPS